LAEVRVAFRNAGFSRSAALREPRAAARFFGHRQRKKYWVESRANKVNLPNGSRNSGLSSIRN